MEDFNQYEQETRNGAPRRRMLVVAAIVAVVLVVAAGAAVLFMQTQEGEGGPRGFPPLDPEAERALQEQADAIIAAGDMARCGEIDNDMYETVCVNNIALEKAQETLDVSHCQNIDNVLIPREDCEREVVFQKSIEREDLAACGEAKSEGVRRECAESFWIRLALANDDSAVCDSAETAEDRTLCSDTYLFQSEFLEDQAAFDCTAFNDKDVREDCARFAEEGASATTSPALCGAMQSDLFSAFCTRSLFGGGLPRPF